MNLWRQRLEASLAISAQEPPSRFFQLATVDSHGEPHNRTVVFRQFDPAVPDRFYVVTDIRSQKWAQLAHNNRAAICWYFVKSQEQYRLSCEIQLYQSDKELPVVQTLWKGLSKATQLSFYGAPPGSGLREASKIEEPATGKIPDNFGVLETNISGVDYLSLASQPHYRELHRRQGGDWDVQQLQP